MTIKGKMPKLWHNNIKGKLINFSKRFLDFFHQIIFLERLFPIIQIFRQYHPRLHGTINAVMRVVHQSRFCPVPLH